MRNRFALHFWGYVFVLSYLLLSLFSGCDSGSPQEGDSSVGVVAPRGDALGTCRADLESQLGVTSEYAGFAVGYLVSASEVSCPSPLFSDAECRVPSTGGKQGGVISCVALHEDPATRRVYVSSQKDPIMRFSYVDFYQTTVLDHTITALCSASGRWLGWACVGSGDIF
jgi:hypothetical protein